MEYGYYMSWSCMHRRSYRCQCDRSVMTYNYRHCELVTTIPDLRPNTKAVQLLDSIKYRSNAEHRIHTLRIHAEHRYTFPSIGCLTLKLHCVCMSFCPSHFNGVGLTLHEAMLCVSYTTLCLQYTCPPHCACDVSSPSLISLQVSCHTLENGVHTHHYATRKIEPVRHYWDLLEGVHKAPVPGSHLQQRGVSHKMNNTEQ